MHWRDTGVTALGSASDAVVKFDSVGVPAKYLLRFVPGLTKAEIEEAVKAMEKEDKTSGAGSVPGSPVEGAVTTAVPVGDIDGFTEAGNG